MLSRPSFTIGIPVRNGEAFLAAAIKSAVSQTRPADEILVMDDNSTDQTRAIATSERWNGRVRYEFNLEPSGFADAFNRVAGAAKSRFFVLLSADDLLDPNLLEEIEKALQSFPEAGFCYVGNRYMDKIGRQLSKPLENVRAPLRFLDGESYVRDYLSGILSGKEIHRCLGFAVERRLIVEECPFRKEAGILADNDFFLRVASKTKVVGINRQLASVRVHSGSETWRSDSLHLKLAEDYLFLISSLRGTSTIRGENLATVCHLACRIFNSLLKEAVSRGRMDLGDSALRLIRATADEIGEQPFREAMKQDCPILRCIYGMAGRVRLYRRMLALASWARNVSWLKSGKDCVLHVLRRCRAKSWT